MHPRYGRRLPLTPTQGLRLSTASWAVPAASILLAMGIHGLSDARAYPFFISEADYSGLQDSVFSLGLTLAGLIQLTYAWHLYHALEAERDGLWFAATVVAIIAATNTVLVANLDMYDHINPHILTSMLAFGGGILWVALAQRALGQRAHPTGQRWRKTGLVMAGVGFFVMVVSFQLAVNGIDASDLTTEAFLNQAQSGIRIAAPAEYVLVAGLLLSLASFRHELKQVEPSTLRDH